LFAYIISFQNYITSHGYVQLDNDCIVAMCTILAIKVAFQLFMLKLLMLPSLPLPLREVYLVDGLHLPRYWATVWSAMSLGELSHNTRVMKLRYVEDLYVYADSMGGPGFFDDALASLDVNVLSNHLEGFFIGLRNKSNRTAADETRWNTVYGFISDVVAWISKGALTQDSFAKVLKRLQHICFANLSGGNKGLLLARNGRLLFNIHCRKAAVPQGSQMAVFCLLIFANTNV
jgi:hypothetical protein